MNERPGRTTSAARPTGGGSLLTTRDLALAMGVSESSIKRWADEGEGQADGRDDEGHELLGAQRSHDGRVAPREAHEEPGHHSGASC